MSETSFAGNQLLTSWKEIAAYLGKGVRTVQRWEATLGLPVIRPNGSGSNIVMARSSDLEEWVLQGRTQARREPASLLKMDEAKSRLAASLQELRRTRREVTGKLRQVASKREEFVEELRRFESLFAEWNAIQSRFKGTNTPPKAKVN